MSFLQYLSCVLEEKEEFFKKGLFKNSTKFTGKHLCRGLFCNKVAGWRPATSLNTNSGRGAFL